MQIANLPGALLPEKKRIDKGESEASETAGNVELAFWQ